MNGKYNFENTTGNKTGNSIQLKNQYQRSIRHLVCKQVSQISKDTQNKEVIISNHPVSSFIICGYVAEHPEPGIQISILIDDCTTAVFFNVAVRNIDINKFVSKYVQGIGYFSYSENTWTPTLTHIDICTFEQVIFHQIISLWWHMKLIKTPRSQYNDTNPFIENSTISPNSTTTNTTTISTVNPNDPKSMYMFFTNYYKDKFNPKGYRSLDELLTAYNMENPINVLTSSKLHSIMLNLVQDGNVYYGEKNDQFFFVDT